MFCFFIWLDSVISIVSRLFDLILRLLEYLGFLHFEGLSLLSVSISSNLCSISISEIFGLCLLDSFFQGNLFLGVSSGLSVLSNFFSGKLLDFLVMRGMPGVCCCFSWVFFGLFFWGLQQRCCMGGSSSLNLVQYRTWLSKWSSFPFVIHQVVSSILLLYLSCQGESSFLDFG